MANSVRRRAAKAHVVERAKERFGLVLTEDDILRMNRKLWIGDAIEFSKPKRNGRKYFVEVLAGEYLPVVYHRGLRSVVTVLGRDAPEVQWGLAKHYGINLISKDTARLPLGFCQKCGSHIGLLGALWQMLRLPIHRCAPTGARAIHTPTLK